MSAPAHILMLAGKIDETCTRLVLEWGDAIRRARANPSDKGLEEAAREAGRLVGGIGAALSERLGRTL